MGGEVVAVALAARVEAFAKTRSLWRAGDRILVAVSGGPDSVALLHVLNRLGPSWRLELHVLHVDHGLRPDGPAEAASVGQLCDEWGLPFHTVSVDTAGERRGGESIQQAARRLRLAALRARADETGARRIALGHHRDDQAETVLLRLLRGAGPTGLGGMRPRRGPFIRPLLEISRRDIEAYCAAHGLPTVDDPSNVSEMYMRNRIRRRLLPQLQAEYNPHVVPRLARTAELLQADDDLLERLAAAAYGRARIGEPSPASGPVVLAADATRRVPLALRRRIVRRALKDAGADLRRVTYDHTDAAVALLEGDGPGAVTLPGPVRVFRRGNRLYVGGEPDGPVAPPSAPGIRAVLLEEDAPRRELHVPGRTEIGGVAVEAYFSPAEAVPGDGARLLAAARLDRDRLQPPLFVQSRQPGDRMRPVGLGGTKKLQDLFVDEKVPRSVRDRVLIVRDGAGILWIPGLRIDERAAAVEGTRNILYLRVSAL